MSVQGYSQCPSVLNHTLPTLLLIITPPPPPPQMSVQGYSQKLPVLLDLLVDQLASFSVRPDRFAVMAEAAKREYANIAFQQVYQWAMYRAEVRPSHGQAAWVFVLVSECGVGCSGSVSGRCTGQR
jgi:hypothetical protein